jgi:hypothetical protein
VIVAAAMLSAAVVAAAPQQNRTQSQPQPGGRQQAVPLKVSLDELEANPEKYLGKTVQVEGDVDRVLGPHLFTVQEKKWLVLEREMPVVVPEPFTAIVRSGAPARVTGVVEKVPIAEVSRVRPLLSNRDKILAEIETKPALIATEVTTVTPAVADLRVLTEQPVGTSGRGANTAPITNANEVASAKTSNAVGRRVNLSNATVSETNPEGFWIRTPAGDRIFVMPVKKTDVKQGQTADIEGVVLELPEGLRVQIKGASAQQVYIYADKVAAR